MRLLPGVWFFGLLWLACGSPALAQGGDLLTWEGKWQGRDINVAVVVRGRTVGADVRAKPWYEWGNQSTDAWLFGFGRERYELVLDFSRRPDNRPQVTIYTLTERTQPLRVREGEYRLPQNTYPHMVLTPDSRNSDWYKNGAPNFNLEGTIVNARDGGPEWDLRVHGDGWPRWYYQRRSRDPDSRNGYPRFGAGLRDPSVPWSPAQPFLPPFPYLHVMDSLESDFYGPDRPLVYQINGRNIRQLWQGFQRAGIWHINSLAFPPTLNFEAPFAWYRLDPQGERVPNLVIRNDIWPNGSSFGPQPFNLYRVARRMTWTLENAANGQRVNQPLWRYSVSVIGNHSQANESVTLGKERLVATPYHKYAEATTERPWKAAALVEATRGERGSEGIYDYSVEDNYPVAYWVNGTQDALPTDFRYPFLQFDRQTITDIDPRNLRESFRGEFSLDYNRKPEFYRSPVDGRVHLLYAEGGLWNLNNRQVLRYYNLDGDAHVDGWVRETVPAQNTPTPRGLKGQVEEALYVLQGFVFYSGPSGATVRRSLVEPETERLFPVKDEASWRTWIASERRASPRDPFRLRDWAFALGGREILRESGSRIEDLHTIPGGLRLVLASGAERTVVEYNRQTAVWTRQVGTPAQIAPRLEASLTALEPSWLRLTLANSGTLDFVGRGQLKAGGKALESWREVRVPGRGELVLEVPYTARDPGPLEFSMVLGGKTYKLPPVQVLSNPPERGLGVVLLSSSVRQGWVALVLLGLIGLVMWTQWRASRWL